MNKTIKRISSITVLIIMTAFLIACNKTTYLDQPSIYNLNHGLLSWSGVNYASYYQVEIINDDVTITLQTKNKSIEIDKYLKENDEYIITVQAFSNEEDVVDSIKSIPFIYNNEIVQLETPTLSRDKNIISWNAIEDAEQYRVKINGFQVYTTDTSYDLEKHINTIYDTQINFEVTAISNDIKKKDSEPANLKYTFYVKELIKPVLTMDEFKLTWSEVEFAYQYQISIKDSNFNTINVNNLSYDFESKFVGIEFDKEYEIEVKPLFLNTLYDSKKYTSSIKHTFNQPTKNTPTIYYEDGFVKWNDTSDAYTIYIIGNSFRLSVNYFNLAAYLTSPSYYGQTVEVYVQAIENYGIPRSKPSNVLQITMPYKKVSTPYYLYIEENAIHWGSTSNTGYLVNINDKTYETRFSSLDLMKVEGLEPGSTYDIEVIALGSEETKLSNADPISIQYTTPTLKLETPVISEISETHLLWNQVPHAIGYLVNINGNTYQTKYNSFKLSRHTLLRGIEYKISVMAIGNAIDYLQSDYSEIFEYMIPEIIEINPPVLMRDGNILYWEAIEGITSYTFHFSDNASIITRQLSMDITYFLESNNGEKFREFYLTIEHDREGNNNKYSKPSESVIIELI